MSAKEILEALASFRSTVYTLDDRGPLNPREQAGALVPVLQAFVDSRILALVPVNAMDAIAAVQSAAEQREAEKYRIGYEDGKVDATAAHTDVVERWGVFSLDANEWDSVTFRCRLDKATAEYIARAYMVMPTPGEVGPPGKFEARHFTMMNEVKSAAFWEERFDTANRRAAQMSLDLEESRREGGKLRDRVRELECDAGDPFIQDTRATIADLRAKLTLMEKWNDAPDEWSAAIAEAFPTNSGSHDTYATAMTMVGNRHSKAALVALVNWLLVLSMSGELARSG